MTKAGTTCFEVLRRMGPATAPTRRLVRDYLSKKVWWQINQIPRAPLTVAPITPRPDPTTECATPLSLVCIDTFFTPPSTHRGEPGRANARNAKLNVWRSAVIVLCATTKYCYVRPCRLRAELDTNNPGPHSETARGALVESRRRVRVESQIPQVTTRANSWACAKRGLTTKMSNTPKSSPARVNRTGWPRYRYGTGAGCLLGTTKRMLAAGKQTQPHKHNECTTGWIVATRSRDRRIKKYTQ